MACVMMRQLWRAIVAASIFGKAMYNYAASKEKGDLILRSR
jgi:hypothetical protein